MTPTDLDPWLVRIPDGTLHELGREVCAGCKSPMPDADSGEACWRVPGRGVFHERCFQPERAPR